MHLPYIGCQLARQVSTDHMAQFRQGWRGMCHTLTHPKGCSWAAHLVAECVKVMMGTRAPSLGCVSRYRVTRASMRQPTASRSTCFLVFLSSLCCGVVEAWWVIAEQQSAVSVVGGMGWEAGSRGRGLGRRGEGRGGGGEALHSQRTCTSTRAAQDCQRPISFACIVLNCRWCQGECRR